MKTVYLILFAIVVGTLFAGCAAPRKTNTEVARDERIRELLNDRSQWSDTNPLF